ncbi:hypothetical protein Pan216_18620 [Planctomycetes bacterium Pan216]|uniref:Uncharacterized protein n=1 Tax=Kolteria novifilia TaxID=2527975 RepID=A0A518B204_9BACT|nr:hypothetical protein Pan216_18620 [Planctomycetes bacterium Pan216]
MIRGRKPPHPLPLSQRERGIIEPIALRLTKRHLTKRHLTKRHLTKRHLTKRHLTKRWLIGG